MAAGWAVLEMETLGVQIGRVLAAEREELIALMVAARREPDPLVRERCESEIRELRVQHQRAMAERLCTEARLRRQGLLRQLAGFAGPKPTEDLSP